MDFILKKLIPYSISTAPQKKNQENATNKTVKYQDRNIIRIKKSIL